MERQSNLLSKISQNFKRISPSVRVLERAGEIADFVLEKEAKYAKKSTLELKNTSYRMMDEIAKGVPLDNFLVDGLAIAREIIFRVHGQKAYRVQIIGAIVAHFGDFAEMRTGEGKTLTLLLVSYVNALSRKGVHIVTVNEYLVKRDMEFSQAALGELGIVVGYVTSDMKPMAKKNMYNADITYISNSELGFDYLRDNMVQDYEKKMQRPLNFAIVDEADSILIDEARTPLIIAGNPLDTVGLYIEADDFVKSLVPDDYVIDLESNAINLNDNGIRKAEKHFEINNLYEIENSPIVHKMMNALRANFIMEIGKEYIVRFNRETGKNEIALVDAFTGRIMEGRMYSAGLHQAIQAKERVPIEPENVTLATITYQSFFRLYKKLAGLSGTALTEKQEFLDIYNMVVVPIPTNEPMIRVDQPDYVFGSKQMKWKYVAAEIKRRHAKGQPILVGTVSVEDSELLHRLLVHLGIKHNILNAKNHAIEAEIIKQAGYMYAVTIATNMAGRGTDIKLGPGVRELGGLFVIGTERNESRRIDNQLRGRSGRQGDLGESRFFISLQDSLFKRFASDRFEKAQYKIGEEVIDLKFFSRLLDKTQMRVENINYDIRKNLIDYDYVLSEQRQLIYKQRDAILKDENLLALVYKMIPRVMDVLVILNRDDENVNVVHIERLLEDIKLKLGIDLNINVDTMKDLMNADIFKFLCIEIRKYLTKFYQDGDVQANNKTWRTIILQALDTNWTEFLDKIQKLRDGVSLRSYEQRSPLNIYVEDSDRLFYNTSINIAQDAIHAIVKNCENRGEFQSSADASELKFFNNSNLQPQQPLNKDAMKTTTIDDLAVSSPLRKEQLNATQTVSSIKANDIQDVIDKKRDVKDVVEEIWSNMNPVDKHPDSQIIPKSPDSRIQGNGGLFGFSAGQPKPEYDMPKHVEDPNAPKIYRVTNSETEVVHFGADSNTPKVPTTPSANPFVKPNDVVSSAVNSVVDEILANQQTTINEIAAMSEPIEVPISNKIEKPIVKQYSAKKAPAKNIMKEIVPLSRMTKVKDVIPDADKKITSKPIKKTPKKAAVKAVKKPVVPVKPVVKKPTEVSVKHAVPVKPVAPTITPINNKSTAKPTPPTITPANNKPVAKTDDNTFLDQVMKAVDEVSGNMEDFSEMQNFINNFTGDFDFDDDLDDLDLSELGAVNDKAPKTPVTKPTKKTNDKK